jgi:hypothetical protein
MSRKKGPTVTIRGEELGLMWHGSNFQVHYQRHPANEKTPPGFPDESECWADVVGHPGSQASEKESLMHYQCADPRHGRLRDHFLDGRLVETITPDHSTARKELSIVTRMHRHLARKHRSPGDPPVREAFETLNRDLGRKEQAGKVPELKVFRSGLENPS